MNRILSNKLFIKQSSQVFSNTSPRILVSGGFEIFHEGHLEYLNKADSLIDRSRSGDKGSLFIIVNGDEFIRRKHKREPIFPEKFRAKLISQLFPNALLTIYNKKDDVGDFLLEGYFDVFGNGGDRKQGNLNSREAKICKEKNIRMVSLGSKKLNSTSDIIKNIKTLK